MMFKKEITRKDSEMMTGKHLGPEPTPPTTSKSVGAEPAPVAAVGDVARHLPVRGLRVEYTLAPGDGATQQRADGQGRSWKSLLCISLEPHLCSHLI